MRQNKLYLIYIGVMALFSVTLLAGCSSTSALKEGEQLFTGLKPIEYTNYEEGTYADSTKAEMESVLASAPNGSLFGSSYHRTPFPIRLWIWNAFSQSNGIIPKWITKTFGSQPKLMGNVNPQLRSQVAENQLMKYGYFNGKVKYDIITGTNPKTAKVAYHVDLGRLCTLDSVAYLGFPDFGKQLIDSTHSQALIGKGTPFNVSLLEQERQRITRLFRNNGFYYYKNGYASYLADTVTVPGKAQVRLVLADSIDTLAKRQWYIGNIRFNYRKQFGEQLTDSFVRRYLSFHYTGKKMPIRGGVMLRDLHLRPRQLYKVENEEAAKKSLVSMGLFSYTNIQFTPRRQVLADSTSVIANDTLDANIDLVFDKPYDFYVEANAKAKTTRRVGPELVVGLVKRNAFKGGEKLDINLHGSHEWQTIRNGEGNSNKINSYEVGAEASLSLPRIITPWNMFRTMEQNERRFRQGHFPRRYYGIPTTSVKASMNILNRAGYFRRHVVSGELTYDWATSYQHSHSFSPLVLSYEYMNSKTDAYEEVVLNYPALIVAMENKFVPKMSYTYTYKSPQNYQNPVVWATTVSEAANILSLGYMAAGKKWNETDKTMFKNPFAQFLKVETDFVKYWKMGEKSTLVGHVDAGVIWSYGNSVESPYTERFYVGGANSIRAFTVRGIGPGDFDISEFPYILRTGDIKFVANLEYRPQIWGSLYGALFLDAGNVWNMDKEYAYGAFKFNTFYKQMAVGTGVGLRYDIGMFVVRVDWGVGLHLPYDTGKGGFFNVDSFKNAQNLHLAVGYPF